MDAIYSLTITLHIKDKPAAIELLKSHIKTFGLEYTQTRDMEDIICDLLDADVPGTAGLVCTYRRYEDN